MSIADFRDEFLRHRDLIRKAIDQAGDDGLTATAGEHNSLAVNIRHLHGFLSARFTDFLTTDGDKPWRRRDEEFVPGNTTRAEVLRLHEEGWRIAAAALGELTDADLARTVSFRGQHTSAHKALVSLLAHVAYHAGQVVLLARQRPATAWSPVTAARPSAQRVGAP
jgi:uncharacterized damage-inducible protein DinB